MYPWIGEVPGVTVEESPKAQDMASQRPGERFLEEISVFDPCLRAPLELSGCRDPTSRVNDRHKRGSLSSLLEVGPTALDSNPPGTSS